MSGSVRTVPPVSVPLCGVAARSWPERYAGEARAGVPVTHETLFPLASVTKPIAAATFMTLVDDGVISLDEPVGRLLPEFRAGPAAGAEGVDPTLERLRPTIGARQLLCHVSGLPEDLGPRESRYRDGAHDRNDDRSDVPAAAAIGSLETSFAIPMPGTE